MAGIADGTLTATPQNDAESTYAPMIKEEDGRLDWGQTSEELERRIRAMTPWPGAFTLWQEELLKVIKATVVDGRLPPKKFRGSGIRPFPPTPPPLLSKSP